MFDVLLGSDGDLKLVDGDIVLTESVSQAIKIRLKWFMNEWRFNTLYGVPYYEQIFVKGYNKQIIEQLIREQIMNVDEVADVREITLSINIVTRELSIKFSAGLESGELLEQEEVIVHG